MFPRIFRKLHLTVLTWIQRWVVKVLAYHRKLSVLVLELLYNTGTSKQFSC